jgi:hypothetical protein
MDIATRQIAGLFMTLSFRPPRDRRVSACGVLDLEQVFE